MQINKLAGFFGMTAPSIVVIDYLTDGRLNLARYSSILDYKLNSSIHDDIDIEFNYLRQSLANTPFLIKSELETQEMKDLLRKYRTCKIQGSNIVGNIEDNVKEEVYNYCVLNFILTVFDTILSGEKQNKFVNINTEVSAMQSIAKECISNNVSINSISVEARKYVKTLEDGTESIVDSITQTYAYKKSYTPLINVGGSKSKLSEESTIVFNWFMERVNRIEYLHSSIERDTREEAKVFTSSLSDIIRRKPESFKFSVTRNLEFLNTTRTKAIASNFIQMQKREIAKYSRLLQDSVVVKNTIKKDNPFDKSSLPILENKDPEAFNLVQKIFDNNYLGYRHLQDGDFELFMGLARYIIDLDFNKAFGLNLTNERWSEVFSELNQVGICGLNHYTKELFVDSFDSFSLLDEIKIVDTKEQYEKRKTHLEDIEALLDSIIPIGKEVD